MMTLVDAPLNVLLNLPYGWRSVALGDVCDFLDYRRVPVNETERKQRIADRSQSELYPYYGANGQVGWIDDYLFDEPLILLAEDGGSFGSRNRPIAYAVEGRCWVNNHAHVLRPKECIDFRFCLHALAIRPDIGQMVSGSTRAKLNQEIAARIPMPLPPLAEQRRIAAQLDGAMAAVERARAAAVAQLDAAQRLPAAHLLAAFEHEGAAPGPATRLADLCGFLPARSIAVSGDTDVLAITSACLTEVGFRADGVKRARMWARDAAECVVAPGEILVARSNTADLVGRVAVFRGDPPNTVASDLTIRLLPQSGVDGEFLAAWLSARYVGGYWKPRAGGASGSMKKITRTQLADLQIPLPPLEDQKRIATVLGTQLVTAQLLIQRLKDQLAAIEQLPAALLRQAFQGAI
jgi:type I restriction enzyme S subunit